MKLKMKMPTRKSKIKLGTKGYERYRRWRFPKKGWKV
jgi:hypothetical protein